MKKVIRKIILTFLALLLVGCSTHSERSRNMPNTNTTDDVLKNQIEQVNRQEESKEIEVNSIEQDREGRGTLDHEISQEVNYDLTEMDGNMVYAIVWQLMRNPNEYIGKTFKIKGNYYVTWYEPTQQYYHYVLIQDATACCAQGLEFVWGDGNHIYPDEYPEDGTVVEILGEFETYQEEGEQNLYGRLKDATFKVIDE